MQHYREVMTITGRQTTEVNLTLEGSTKKNTHTRRAQKLALFIVMIYFFKKRKKGFCWGSGSEKVAL